MTDSGITSLRAWLGTTRAQGGRGESIHAYALPISRLLNDRLETWAGRARFSSRIGRARAARYSWPYCALKNTYISVKPLAIVISHTQLLKPQPRILEEKMLSIIQTRLAKPLRQSSDGPIFHAFGHGGGVSLSKQQRLAYRGRCFT